MSNEASPMPTEQPDVSTLPSTVMHSHRSYRRKYRKIMVKFEREMRDSSSLFRDQQRIHDISQRIAEQNDQILSLLLELNSHPQVPGRLRYDLQDSATVKNVDEHGDAEQALINLRTARNKVQTDEKAQPDYEQLERSLLNTVEFAPKKSYVDLLKLNPLERHTLDDEDPSSPLAGGFLSSKQEEQYLQSLDNFCANPSLYPNPRAHALGNLGYPAQRITEKSLDREREFQLKNPVSVYNWLRKNQPQVFLQDPDHEKGKKTAEGSRKSKRESAVKKEKVKKEEEESLNDEDGVATEEKTKTGGKRKRDEDGGYRPKGGHARPNKRRKEDGGRRSKRASMDISNS